MYFDKFSNLFFLVIYKINCATTITSSLLGQYNANILNNKLNNIELLE